MDALFLNFHLCYSATVICGAILLGVVRVERYWRWPSYELYLVHFVVSWETRRLRVFSLYRGFAVTKLAGDLSTLMIIGSL